MYANKYLVCVILHEVLFFIYPTVAVERQIRQSHMNSSKLSLELPQSNEEDKVKVSPRWTNINAEVDVVIPMILNHLHNIKIEHLNLPDITETISLTFILVAYKTRLILSNGIVYNVEGIERYGDAKMTYKDKWFHIRFDLKINKLQITMDAEMPTAPTHTIRSAVTVPRSKTTPVAAPRTTIATAAPRAVSTAPLNDTRSTAPEPPQLECALCHRRHRLPRCGIFKGMTPQQRQQIAQAPGHCLNCLAPTHRTQECTAGYQCQVCMRHHHTLLHRTGVLDGGRHDAPRRHDAIRRPKRSQPRRPAYPTEHSRSWRHRNPPPNRRRQPRPTASEATRLDTRLGGPGCTNEHPPPTSTHTPHYHTTSFQNLHH